MSPVSELWPWPRGRMMRWSQDHQLQSKVKALNSSAYCRCGDQSQLGTAGWEGEGKQVYFIEIISLGAPENKFFH